MRTKADWVAFYRDGAKENAINEMKRLEGKFSELVETIARRRKDIEDERKSEGMTVTLDDYFEWMINDVENAMRNINFSTLARINGELKRVVDPLEVIGD